MSKSIQRLLIASATVVACSASVAAFATAPTNYTAAVDQASSAYQAARGKCDSHDRSVQDNCVAHAKMAEEAATDNARQTFMGSIKARTTARVATADANYKTAKDACNDKSGNAQDVCIAEAKAAQTKSVARAEADKEVVDARSDAREDAMGADYKVAITKCDALTGDAEYSCVAAAKAKFHK